MDENYNQNMDVFSASGNNTVSSGDIDISAVNELLEGQTSILENLEELSDFLMSDEMLSTSLYVNSSSSDIDGYFFQYDGENVYIPTDKVQYIGRTSSGELINMSSQTITCMALNSDGSHGHTYRFQSFGKPERYNYYSNNYNNWWQWDYVQTSSDNSNLVFGQTGLNNITDVFLFIILVLLAFSCFIRWRH